MLIHGTGRRLSRLTLGAAVALAAAGCVTVAPAPSVTPTGSGTPTPAVSTPAASPLTRIALITDYGTCDPRQEAVATMVKAWPISAIVTTGDNTQNRPGCVPYEQSVWGYYDRNPDGTGVIPFWPAPGNHDYTDEGAGMDAYRQAFPYLPKDADPQQRWYTVNLGRIQTFVIDTELTPEELETQKTWLEAELKKSRATNPETWNLVLLHRPAYTSGPHEPKREMRPDAGWTYRDWGADIVMAGHQHVYEDLIVDDFHYLTTGVGGGLIDRDCPVEQRDYSRVCIAGTSGSGAIMIEATAQHLVLRYYMFADGPEGQPTIADTIALTRD